jgi:hypothetical protein
MHVPLGRMGNCLWPAMTRQDVTEMPPPLHDIQEHVARITASSGFTNSERLR